MNITIPDYALIVVIGPSNGDTAAFVREQFCGDKMIAPAVWADATTSSTTASAGADALEARLAGARRHLARRESALVDASALGRKDRQALVALAKAQHAVPIAIVLSPGQRAHGTKRAQGLPGVRKLQGEGFRKVQIIDPEDARTGLSITRLRLAVDRRCDHGPFDIIGDLHGCFDEAIELLDRLGYAPEPQDRETRALSRRHPEGRTAIFLGDLTDRGPRSLDCLRLVMSMCAAGAALCVIGNHDHKLQRRLDGKGGRVGSALAQTLAELEPVPDAFRAEVATFIRGLPSHLWLAGGRLVIAHAGLPAEMHGRDSTAIREIAMFGETMGERDDRGLPVRSDWAQDYRGAAEVIYGHTPRSTPVWVNRTLCIDTGCAFGAHLTALRWPERQMVSVPAARNYASSKEPGEDGTDSASGADFLLGDA